MPAFFGILTLSVAFLFGINYTETIEQKNAQIHQLATQLQSQSGAQLATHEFYERQASVYLGCKQFFNLCPKDVREIGEMRVKDGYSGATAGYYWVGLLGFLFCIATALGIFSALLITVTNFLNLKLIEPKREDVEQKQLLIDTAEERSRAENLRANQIQKQIGLLKKELHIAAHPPKKKSSPLVITPPAIPLPSPDDTPKNKDVSQPKPRSEDLDDY